MRPHGLLESICCRHGLMASHGTGARDGWFALISLGLTPLTDGCKRASRCLSLCCSASCLSCCSLQMRSASCPLIMRDFGVVAPPSPKKLLSLLPRPNIPVLLSLALESALDSRVQPPGLKLNEGDAICVESSPPGFDDTESSVSLI